MKSSSRWLERSEADRLPLDEKALRRLLQLDPRQPCADWYFHHRSCVWVVGEEKGYDRVRDSIRRLEETIRQLKRVGRPVHQAQVRVVRGLGRREGRLFGRSLEGHLLQKIGRKRKRIVIEGVPALIEVG